MKGEMKGRAVKYVVAGVIVAAGVALLAASFVQRNAGQLWMPWLHLVGWAVLMVGVAVLTYDPEEAAKAAEVLKKTEVIGDSTKKAA